MAYVRFGEMFIYWKLLVGFYGMEELGNRCNFQQENIRECLMKLLTLFSDNKDYLNTAVSGIHILTVIQAMTFTAQMGGINEGNGEFEQSVWVDPEKVTLIPQPTPPKPMRIKLKNLYFMKSEGSKDHLLSEVRGAVEDLTEMIGQCSANPSLKGISTCLGAVQALLDDVQTVLQTI